MDAVIVGATGLVGSELVARALLFYDRVTVLTRRPTTAKDPRIVEVVADLEHDDLPIPADADVFCALGTTIAKAGSQEAFRRIDHDLIVRVAQNAAQHGAAQFVLVSSAGANQNSSNFYLRVKGETDAAVATLPFFGVHIFRPSVLLGDRRETRRLEAVGMAAGNLLSWILIGGLRKYRAISASDVAIAMIEAARKRAPGVHTYEYDQIVELAGPSL